MKIFKSRCYNGGNKHKYSPRFTSKPNSNIKFKTVWYLSADDFKKILYYTEYLYDICEWCGNIKAPDNKSLHQTFGTDAPQAGEF